MAIRYITLQGVLGQIQLDVGAVLIVVAQVMWRVSSLAVNCLSLLTASTHPWISRALCQAIYLQ